MSPPEDIKKKRIARVQAQCQGESGAVQTWPELGTVRREGCGMVFCGECWEELLTLGAQMAMSDATG